MEQTFDFEYGISREQACILCHMSAECSGCCIKCDHPNGCQGQRCSQPSREHDGQRWDTWMYLLREHFPRLKKFIKPELRKKYGIDRMLRKKEINMTKPINFDEKLEHSISLLKKAEPMALSYFSKGFYLAFSGGKDSQSLYHVAKMAGVKFEAHYALTTLDPPELVHFIRNHYPDVIIDRPQMTFAQMCLKKKALPTMRMRFCCALLKETKGAGTVTLTGVRRQESAKRSRRNEAEKIGSKKARFSGTFEQLDQFTRQKELDGVQCVNGKDKIVINPIIDWTEADVWYFLNEVAKVEHCGLYDRGWRRIGCLFCPMASKKEIIRQGADYPKYQALILRTIRRLREKGYMNQYNNLTDEEVFAWWISKQGIRHWYAENKLQLKLFEV